MVETCCGGPRPRFARLARFDAGVDVVEDRRVRRERVEHVEREAVLLARAQLGAEQLRERAHDLRLEHRVEQRLLVRDLEQQRARDLLVRARARRARDDGDEAVRRDDLLARRAAGPLPDADSRQLRTYIASLMSTVAQA